MRLESKDVLVVGGWLGLGRAGWGRLGLGLVAWATLGLGGCVVDSTPGAEDGADGSADDARPGADGGAGDGRGGAGGWSADGGAAPDAEAWTCEVACRPTGVCPGEGAFCNLRGCCALPSAPAVPHITLGRGAGVILLSAEVLDDTYDANALYVAFDDGTVEVSLQPTVAARRTVQRAFYTDSQSTAAEVWVRDSTGLSSVAITVPVVDLPIRDSGEGCDPTGFTDWCGEGALCLSDDGQQTGTCFRAQAQVWRWNESLMLDVRSPAPLRFGTEINAFTLGDRLASPWQNAGRTDWRWTGVVPVIEGRPEVRYRAHLLASRVAAQDPITLRPGAVCDVERLADVCPRGTACQAGVCDPISAPDLWSVQAVWRDGALALTLSGHDEQADADGYELALIGAEPAQITGLFGARRSAEGLFVDSGANWAAARFVAWWSAPVATRPRAVRLTLVDREGLRSETLEVPVTEPETPNFDGALGAACDRAGLLGTCEPTLACAGTPTDPSIRCRAGYTTCPGLATTPLVFVDGVAEASEPANHTAPGAEDDPLSCVGGAGGRTRYYAFEAPAAGRYRVSIVTDQWGGPFHVAARPFCNLTVEVACAGMYTGDQPTFELELSAGEPMTLAFMATWSRSMGAPFTLRVEALD